MEVPMLKTHRRTLHFDCLERKVLLSTAMADPALSVHRAVAKRFVLNGALYGLPTGSAGPDGYTVASFAVAGHLGSMGRVQGTFLLNDKFVPIGKLPDLSKSLLIVTNRKGSLLLSIQPSETHRYHFQIVAVTRSYASASGSGTVTISPQRGSIDLVLEFRSDHR
jgi:hypothetical protein